MKNEFSFQFGDNRDFLLLRKYVYRVEVIKPDAIFRIFYKSAGERFNDLGRHTITDMRTNYSNKFRQAFFDAYNDFIAENILLG